MKFQITTKCDSKGYRYFFYNECPYSSAVVLFCQVVTDYAASYGLTFRPEPRECNPGLLDVEWGDHQFVIPVPFIDCVDNTVTHFPPSLDSFIRSLTHSVGMCLASRTESDIFEFEIPSDEDNV